MNKEQILKKLAELDELREALLGQVANMSNDEKIKVLEAAQPSVNPKSPQLEALLQAGYPGMTAKKARKILKQWEEQPERWPYEKVEEAEAFLSAYEGRATVVSTRQPWRTRPRA